MLKFLNYRCIVIQTTLYTLNGVKEKMYPDYNAMINEFIRPVVSFFLFVFLILGWVTAFRLMKENTILRIKLGKEEEKVRESFKIWILRKSAPIISPVYDLKNFLLAKQYHLLLKELSKTKGLKFAIRFSLIAGIISNIFGIETNRTS